MRTTPIAPGEYYHIFNRENNKQDIFLDTRDWARFLFLILYFQSPTIFYNIGRYINTFVRSRAFNVDSEVASEISGSRAVELVCFALMPNHFHLLIKEVKEKGISQYMQRVLTAYTKYFNAKYNKSGHLFQGPYKIIHVEDNRQLLHLSAYIHRNPRELRGWLQKEHEYIWSSYQDYVGENRWSNLLAQDMILDQFKNKQEYYHFVKTSPAKMLEAELLTLLLE